jgi:hypothetical protein
MSSHETETDRASFERFRQESIGSGSVPASTVEGFRPA